MERSTSMRLMDEENMMLPGRFRRFFTAKINEHFLRRGGEAFWDFGFVHLK